MNFFEIIGAATAIFLACFAYAWFWVWQANRLANKKTAEFSTEEIQRALREEEIYKQRVRERVEEFIEEARK